MLSQAAFHEVLVQIFHEGAFPMSGFVKLFFAR
jgi:hypothetical protein